MGRFWQIFTVAVPVTRAVVQAVGRLVSKVSDGAFPPSSPLVHVALLSQRIVPLRGVAHRGRVLQPFARAKAGPAVGAHRAKAQPLPRRPEQMTAGTARGRRKMVSPVLVARQAGGARRGRHVPVAVVAAAALLVLALLVQAGKLLRLVARRAGRGMGHAAGAMGAMTGRAVRGDAPVGRVRLVRVARRACLFDGPAVLVVALDALLVSGGAGLLLGGVAVAAARQDVTVVRLVAMGAGAMSLAGGLVHLGVALRAVHAEALGMVRQAGVAALAGLVPAGGQRQPHLAGVASAACRLVRQRQHEVMRMMALLALDALVERFVRRRHLMACAALSDLRRRVRGRRVRIVAADAGARDAVLRVIRVDALVTSCAGPIRRSSDVVRHVAAGALPVGRDPSRSQDAFPLVARPALDRVGLREVVRAVAAHALAVPALEESRLGDDGLVSRMALGTGAERVRARRVLVLVAGRADLDDGSPLGRMLGGDIGVALAAVAGFRRPVLVGAMALDALARAVHDHGRGVSLAARMAAVAVRGRRDRASGLGGAGALRREPVAHRAFAGARVRSARRPRVLDAHLLFVTVSAARKGHLADGRLRKLVALGASDVLVEHVRAMAADRARLVPHEWDVDAAGRCAVALLDRRRARARCNDRHEKRCREEQRLKSRARDRHGGRIITTARCGRARLSSPGQNEPPVCENLS